MTTTETDPATAIIETPGVYDLTEAEYHADPVPGGSLSHTGAIHLLPPHCPAHYRYHRDHPQPPSDVFDIGTAVHKLVLQGEDAVVICDYDSWRTKAAQTQKKAAYAAGKIPLLVEKWQAVQDMAEALYSHRIAAALLTGGKPEQSLFWLNEGLWCRARLDFLPDRPHHNMYGVDYKTCVSAHPDAIVKAMWTYRYIQQADWYLTGLKSLELVPDEYTRRNLLPPFLFIFQEKAPPYTVTVAQPESDALEAGNQLNARAIRVYKECVAAGRWPGYADDVVPVGIPPYADNYLLDMDGELS